MYIVTSQIMNERIGDKSPWSTLKIEPITFLESAGSKYGKNIILYIFDHFSLIFIKNAIYM